METSGRRGASKPRPALRGEEGVRRQKHEKSRLWRLGTGRFSGGPGQSPVFSLISLNNLTEATVRIREVTQQGLPWVPGTQRRAQGGTNRVDSGG